MFDTWYKMGSVLQRSLNISTVITYRLPFDQFQEGFDLMNSGFSGKVILNWN
ncbi:uncharacterized protein METZ01_LOCUS200194 [marine metagenome]|uniref:Alcohol dehydrogenase-like C-terminal domain-containing protein n=1 Tax=marine metagenome TaxID=408172 RepID=A0A382E9P3_9ZZZZ